MTHSSAPTRSFIRRFSRISHSARGHLVPNRAADDGCLGASRWSVAEPELVALGIAIRRLAYAVRIRLPIYRCETSLGDLRDERVEVINKDEVPGVPRMFGLLFDEDRPMFGEFPYCLRLVCKERRRRPEELFVPLYGCRIVGNRNP